jgi:hypothetical protein
MEPAKSPDDDLGAEIEKLLGPAIRLKPRLTLPDAKLLLDEISRKAEAAATYVRNKKRNRLMKR